MIFKNMPIFFTGFLDFLDSPQWRAWPFNSGYGEHVLPAIARLAFITLIMGVILLFLRLLFGPGGPLRDKELEEEARQETQRERAETEALFARGELTELEYKTRMKSLKD
ncbi:MULTISPECIES: SHOCT domain-containing protein [unclassified Pseudodesulfovibrio]|uniref:SHOCT domain-containing protein n=1 Tax=unclassified Pseudodesulfovibrio TaxID=2661612 RepID=UPI001F4F1FC3|nr:MULTISPECIES: SHOCT domain-containing protein [unclassified Pseudodesulfovibrio]MCJ2164047.1 SHOCT domain-containing protein [Pseudodesulfovibrio sp. S3-i]